MKFESLILDIDGTLWDSRLLVADGYNIQLRLENLDHLQVCADDLTPLFGKTLKELNVRAKLGINILAIRRNGSFNVSPGADFTFAEGDVMVVLGDNKALKKVQKQ